jgi:hypothetical protein
MTPINITFTEINSRRACAASIVGRCGMSLSPRDVAHEDVVNVWIAAGLAGYVIGCLVAEAILLGFGMSYYGPFAFVGGILAVIICTGLGLLFFRPLAPRWCGTWIESVLVVLALLLTPALIIHLGYLAFMFYCAYMLSGLGL